MSTEQFDGEGKSDVSVAPTDLKKLVLACDRINRQEKRYSNHRIVNTIRSIISKIQYW